MTSDEDDRSCTRSSVTVCTAPIDSCRSPAPFIDTTRWLTSWDNGSMMTLTTSPTSRSAQRTFDFSWGCMLLLLNRLWRVHRCILECTQPGGERHDVVCLHEVLILVGHLALFPLFLESFGHKALGVENFLFNVVDREIRADVVQLRTALLPTLAIQLVAVVTFLQLPLLFSLLHKVSGCHAGRCRGSTSRRLFRHLIHAQCLEPHL